MTNLKFEKLSIEHGLSQSTINAIIQDNDGFLWFGTQSGLNKYDGSKFTIFVHDDSDSASISENWITSICQDKYGNIWVGTLGGGLNKLDVHTEEFIHFIHDPNNKLSLNNDKVQALYCDDENNIFVGTDGGGLNIYNSKQNIFKHYIHDPENLNSISSNRINTIYRDKSGNIWIGTQDRGFCKLNWVNKNFANFRRFENDPEDKYSLNNNSVLTIYEDSKGILWVGTEQGLNKYDLAQNKFESYTNDPFNENSISNNIVQSILEDKNGNLWIATDGGLNIFDKKNKLFSRNLNDPSKLNSISSNDTKLIFKDKSGIIWIGTKGGGLNKFNWTRTIFKHYRNISGNPNTLIDNNVYSIFIDKAGYLWIGTNKGLHKFSKNRKKLLAIYNHNPNDKNSISDDLVRVIYQDNEGTMWFGTSKNGLNKYIESKNNFIQYKHDPSEPGSISNNIIRTIYEDSHDNFWIGTWEGLDKFDKKSGEFYHHKYNPEDPNSISDNRVRCIYEDKSGVLWIGTYNGLNLYDRDNNKFYHYFHDPKNKNSISHNRILVIDEDYREGIWIGTYGGGLNRYDKDKKIFIRYTSKEGLVDNSIYAILFDDEQNLWASTNKGLSKFSLLSKRFKNYNVNDGLQSNEFNGGAYFKDNNGEIYFGGINGYNSFFPKDLTENNYVSPILLTSFKVYDKKIRLEKSITQTEKIKLSYKQNFISFEFASLDYKNPNKNKFAYKLEGFDENWTYCGNRQYANYTNLEGGEYLFRVKGTNSDGLWNVQGTNVLIVITPPFWKSWWFILIVSISIVIFVYWLFRLRIKRIEKNRIELKKQVRERTAELISTNRNLRKAKEESQRRESQALLINKVGQRISSELDLNSLLNEIVESVCDAFSYSGVMLLLYDKSKNGLALQSISGSYKNIFPADMLLLKDEGMIGKAFSSKEIQLSNDVTHNEDFVLKSDEVTKSELSVPILDGKKAIGVLDIQSDKLNQFDDTDISTMETFSTQIAAAIKNANLYEQAQLEINERKKTQLELLQSRDSLALAKRETDYILNNVEEGLFLINKKFRIGSQYSKALEKIFEKKDLGDSDFLKFIEDKVTIKLFESTNEFMDLMFDAAVNEETMNDLNPLTEIELNFADENGISTTSKFLSFKFKRIYEGNKINELISTVIDITDQIMLRNKLKESESKTKKQMEWLLNILHVDPQLLKDFVESVQKEINSIEFYMKEGNQNHNFRETLENVYRSVHLVKGNASLLDLKFFVNSTHEFEENIEELQSKKNLSGNDFVPLILRLGDLRKNLNEIHLLINRIGKFHSNFRPKRSYENQMLIDSIENLIRNLSRDIGTQIKFIYKNFNGDNIPYDYRILIKDIFTQMVRNTLAHGIESPEERKVCEKSPVGRIEVSSEVKNNILTLKYFDDGRGIQIEKLRNKAKDFKKWNNVDDFNEKQLSELIFETGISTSEKANVVAGRGLGLDIIKRKVEEYGGKIDYRSVQGKFCEFTISLPTKKNFNGVKMQIETNKVLYS